MPKSSVVIFANGLDQNRYYGLGIDKESLSIFSSADASTILERLKANLVLIDCGIKTMRGLRLLKEIKARHPQIPVVFLTDASSEELAIAAFRAGARDYFVKPVNRLALRKTILGLMKIQEKVSEARAPFRLGSDLNQKLSLDLDVQDVPPRLQEVILYLEENLTDKITLTSLAQKFRMSKYHFSHYFRKHIGLSPIRYLNSARIQCAKKLLFRDDLTIKEIAHQVGYEDLGALIRNFKKIAGGTPTEYRKRSGGDHCGVM